MKKWIAIVSVLAVAVMVAGFISGCEDSLQFPTTTVSTVSTTTTSTSTSSTTTGTVSSSLVDTSKGGAMFANSGNGVAAVASDSQAASASSASIFMVNAFTGPPDTFFSPSDSDGYVTVEGFGTNQSVKVRYTMQSGAAVTPSFLATKGLGVLGAFDWDTMFTGSSPTSTEVLSFANSPTHEALTTIADYMNWAWTAGLVETGWRNNPTINTALGSNHFTNPSPVDSEKIATMEGVVTISGSATGTLNMDITVKSSDDYGLPTGATGSGTIEVGSITLDTTMEVTFTAAGSNETLSLTGTSNDGHTVTINMVTDGSGTGTIKDNTNTTVATMVITAAGEVTVTDTNGNSNTYNL